MSVFDGVWTRLTPSHSSNSATIDNSCASPNPAVQGARGTCRAAGALALVVLLRIVSVAAGYNGTPTAYGIGFRDHTQGLGPPALP